MPSKPPAFATGAILIAGATGAQAFTAYNDLWSTVAGEYSGQNVTTYTLPSEGTASGLLVDYATGATPGYTLAITASTAPAPRRTSPPGWMQRALSPACQTIAIPPRLVAAKAA
jgi:hypothetical protein